MKRYLSSVAALMCAVGTYALEIPEIFSDHMMLQQQTEARLWGWAESGSRVAVRTGWDNKEYVVKADKKTGRWDVKVMTPKASYTSYNIMVSGDGECIALNDVLVGEVWFCSGQSNMEMPLNGFWNCPVEGANETIAQSGRYRNSIRVATVTREGAQEPVKMAKGKWEVCEPENAGRFSACGYYFAQTLTEILDVPVGVIACAWGGSCVEGWLPKEILLTYPDGLTPIDDTDYHAKMVMFNGMLAPLAGYTVKGFLWNQGESNVGREKEYTDRFATMIKLWRKMWNQPDDCLPVYAVELPPYCYGDDMDGTSGADFRAAQHRIGKVLENYGCVSTSDLIYDYEPDQIHGAKKLEIGRRLAYMAATRDYGVGGIAAEAPEFESMEKDAASQAYNLYFTNAQDGFDRLDGIENFEAQDENGNWHEATVRAASAWGEVERPGCYLKLTCKDAKEVKNVRYCYKNFVRGKLHNMRGLPVVPFTTEKK